MRSLVLEMSLQAENCWVKRLTNDVDLSMTVPRRTLGLAWQIERGG